MSFFSTLLTILAAAMLLLTQPLILFQEPKVGSILEEEGSEVVPDAVVNDNQEAIDEVKNTIVAGSICQAHVDFGGTLRCKLAFENIFWLELVLRYIAPRTRRGRYFPLQDAFVLGLSNDGLVLLIFLKIVEDGTKVSYEDNHGKLLKHFKEFE